MIEFVAGWKVDADTFAGDPFVVLAPSLEVALAVVATLRDLGTGRRAEIVGTTVIPSRRSRSALAQVAAEIATIFRDR